MSFPSPTASIRVGTASWSEPEFVKAGWYPPGLAAGQRLAFYAQHFDTVELNSSFYAIPAVGMCEKWVRETPDGFLFDAKVHRLLSRHATKVDALPKDLREQVELNDRENVILTPALEEEVAGRFLEALAPLERAGQLGALLLQLTPSFAPRTADLTALEPVLRQLKGRGENSRRVVLELRHHDWLDGRHASEADELHVVFNNNSRDFAPKAAERLRQRLGQTVQRPRSQKQGELL